MDKFEVLKGVAAPLPMVNVDTDMIIPKQFLKTIKRTGLGRNLFDEMRYTADGQEVADFVLNKPAFRKANILIAGANFGCGSSREHAPWALLDFGIRCIIAPSFADIFFSNCSKNGILAIVLPTEQVNGLMALATGGEFIIDLENRTITQPNEAVIPFEIDLSLRHRLLNGLDDVGLTLQKSNKIAQFESERAASQPWL